MSHITGVCGKETPLCLQGGAILLCDAQPPNPEKHGNSRHLRRMKTNSCSQLTVVVFIACW